MEARQEAVASMAALRMTIREIDEALVKRGMINPTNNKPWTRTTIQTDLNTCREAWRKSAAESTERHMEDLLAEIRQSRKHFFAKEDYTNYTKLVEREAKLLGLDAPQRAELGGIPEKEGGVPISLSILSSMSNDSLLAVLKVVDHLDKEAEDNG
jgi:hypothetical protein